MIIWLAWEVVSESFFNFLDRTNDGLSEAILSEFLTDAGGHFLPESVSTFFVNAYVADHRELPIARNGIT